MQIALPLAEISISCSSSSSGHLDPAPPRTDDPVMQAALIADIFRMRMVLPPDVETTQHDAAGEMGTQTCCSGFAASQMQLQLLQLQIQEGEGPQWQDGAQGHHDHDVLVAVPLQALQQYHELLSMRVQDHRASAWIRRGCAPKWASCSSQQLLAGSAD